MSAKESAAAITAEDILALDTIVTETVPVPEWGSRLTPPQPDYAVTIRTLSVDEVEQLARDCMVPDGKGGQRRDGNKYDQILVRLAVVQPSWTEAQIRRLWVQSAVPVSRLLEAINKLNRTTEAPAQEVAAAAAAFPTEPDPPPAV